MFYAKSAIALIFGGAHTATMSFCWVFLARHVVHVVNVPRCTCSVAGPVRTSVKGAFMTLVLDNNIVSYVLNGELWLRSKSTLMKYRMELQALFEAGHGLETLPLRDPKIRRLMAVYRWVTERYSRWDAP